MGTKVSVIDVGTKLVGEVHCEHILMVAGEVAGDIFGTKVVLKSNGRVAGNITCDSLSIEAGGIFDGQAFMDPGGRNASLPPISSEAKPAPDGLTGE